ncbi:radical SAM family heme chaperone HemW [Litoribacterium kuwaitense]|uniref:radical SAM family heme chaperone HemW n=1 Tax=Litoribacterium kuwaitense TaxID=1398745 RepID=UPI001BA5A6BE|nr:radical SAM family heme chaperone HemW [Litoribacterium kuwaitense]
MKAAYLHVPFCQQICHYCDFSKVFIENQPVDDYLNALHDEVEATLRLSPPDAPLHSIFIGGGTPTALEISQLKKLLSTVQELVLPICESDAEFTVEANPNDLNLATLRELKAGGVNRLSIGQQAFQDAILQTIGRTHRAHDIVDVVERARKVGIEQISIDLMYGLPGQTVADWEESLQKAIALNVDHISAYSLQVEPKTVFYNLHMRGKLPLPPEDDEADMFELLTERLTEAGFAQYEISNFAQPGCESRHNLTYWNNDEYLGAGAGAHGYIQGVRTVNIRPVAKYIEGVRAGSPHLEMHTVTVRERMEEELFLGLRKSEGVSYERFKGKFGMEMPDPFQNTIQTFIEKKLLTEVNGSVKLTDEGRLLGNEVFQSFLGLDLPV